MESTLKSSATLKMQPIYESIMSCKQETHLLQRDRATCIVSLNLADCMYEELCYRTEKGHLVRCDVVHCKNNNCTITVLHTTNNLRG